MALRRIRAAGQSALRGEFGLTGEVPTARGALGRRQVPGRGPWGTVSSASLRGLGAAPSSTLASLSRRGGGARHKPRPPGRHSDLGVLGARGDGRGSRPPPPPPPRASPALRRAPPRTRHPRPWAPPPLQ